ncbi:MAG: reverse transcriptase family protein [Roseburia sp.]|nr:reverse transcriptase family protein [Roseburia sp.]
MREIHTVMNSDVGRKLMRIQKNLYENFLCKLPIATPAHGFVKGKNYQTFLEPHLGSQFFMRLDIENFFPSFSVDLMDSVLREHIEDDNALSDVIALCTLDDELPQGICTSPVLSNILFRRIDQRILKYCQAIEEDRRRNRGLGFEPAEQIVIRYTRYADDMLFSSNCFDFQKNLNFLRMIRRILKEYGFQINQQKTVMGSERVVLNGYILDDKLHLSRKKLQNIRRILYFFRDKNKEEYSIDVSLLPAVTSAGKDAVRQKLLQEVNHLNLQDHSEKLVFSSVSSLIQYLCGYRSWLIAILQTGDDRDKVDKKIPRFINHIEILLEKLEKYES